MPLQQSGSEDAFWKNVAELEEAFKRKGHKPKKARKMAIAAAAEVTRNNGGDPNKWLN